MSLTGIWNRKKVLKVMNEIFFCVLMFLLTKYTIYLSLYSNIFASINYLRFLITFSLKYHEEFGLGRSYFFFMRYFKILLQYPPSPVLSQESQKYLGGDSDYPPLPLFFSFLFQLVVGPWDSSSINKLTHINSLDFHASVNSLYNKDTNVHKPMILFSIYNWHKICCYT